MIDTVQQRGEFSENCSEQRTIILTTGTSNSFLVGIYMLRRDSRICTDSVNNSRIHGVIHGCVSAHWNA